MNSQNHLKKILTPSARNSAKSSGKKMYNTTMTESGFQTPSIDTKKNISANIQFLKAMKKEKLKSEKLKHKTFKNGL